MWARGGRSPSGYRGGVQHARSHRDAEPTERREARGRLPAILGWTVLSTAVGQALSALETLPGGDWLGRFIGSLGALAWGLATYFGHPHPRARADDGAPRGSPLGAHLPRAVGR